MAHQSRRREGRGAAINIAPLSVIVALLATIALVLGLGSTAAIGEETGSPTSERPAESIDPEAHVPPGYVPEDGDAEPGPVGESENPEQAPSESDREGARSELDASLSELQGMVQGGLEGSPALTGISPMMLGPDGPGLAAPYVYWRAVDQNGALIGGATFELEGPRRNNNSWNGSSVITDNVGQPNYTGLDLDPTPGEFAVMFNGNQRISDTSRYRVRSATAPNGATVSSTQWKEIPGSNNSPSRGAWSGGVYNFGDFNFIRNAGHTVQVKKADLRTGLGANQVKASYTVGARFGLFESQTSTTIIDTCEITDPTRGCEFTDVPGGAQYWVQELDPASNSLAELAYSENIAEFSTGTNAGFDARAYRYPTDTLAASGTSRTYTVPLSATSPNWRQTSGQFVNRMKNPPLQQTCTAGVEVALVMDLSGSVAPYRNEFRDAAKGFVNALHTDNGSNSVALFSFGNQSPRADTSNYPTPLSVDNAGRTTLNSRIDNYWTNMVTNQGTNWDAGLWQAAQQAENYDIVLVLTDGNPTYSGSAPDGSGSLTTFREIERAVLSSNVIKDKGTRVVTIGIGGGLADANLSAISGPQGAQPGLSLNDIDYTTSGWAELSGMLNDFARGLSCQAEVNVTKMVEEDGATAVPGADWEFETTSGEGLDVTPVGKQMTDSSGTLSWDIKFTHPDQRTAVTIAETQQPGWTLSNLVCSVNGEVRPVEVAESVTINDVRIGDEVDCTFTNSFYVVEAEVKKEPLAGTAVMVNENGQGELIYTITVSNPNGGTTGNMSVDTGAIRDLVMLPESVSAREEVTVAYDAPIDVIPTGLRPSISLTDFNAAKPGGSVSQGIVLAENLTLPPRTSATFTVTVPIQVYADTVEEWQSLSECILENGSYKSGGAPNGVDMADDADGAANNIACIPIIQQQVSVQKNPRPGEPVQANAQGEADLTFTIVVNNSGGSTGELEATSAKIIESVMLTEEVVANGDITVSFDGDTGVVANGLVASIPQASFVPGAQIVIADSVFLPAGTSGTFTLTVPVKVLADTADEWNELGVCGPGVDIGYSGGIHNAVIMDGDFDGVRNNIACIPILPMPKAAVTIIKEDHNGTELPGAKFALYAASLDGSGVPTGPGDVLVAELGTLPESATRFSADELNPGFYYLVEVQSPAGYSLLPQPIGFQLVYAEQAFSLQLVDAANHEHVVQIDDDLIMRVADTTAGDLPKSGSYGVAPYALLAGMILTLGFVTTRRLGVK